MQVTVPSHPSRCNHSATAFSLSPGLTEVTIFGGCPNVPSNLKFRADLPQIANTTVLRFGESHLMCVSHTSHRSCDRDTTIASHDYVTMQACRDLSLHVQSHPLPVSVFLENSANSVLRRQSELSVHRLLVGLGGYSPHNFWCSEIASSAI